MAAARFDLPEFVALLCADLCGRGPTARALDRASDGASHAEYLHWRSPPLLPRAAWVAEADADDDDDNDDDTNATARLVHVDALFAVSATDASVRFGGLLLEADARRRIRGGRDVAAGPLGLADLKELFAAWGYELLAQPDGARPARLLARALRALAPEDAATGFQDAPEVVSVALRAPGASGAAARAPLVLHRAGRGGGDAGRVGPDLALRLLHRSLAAAASAPPPKATTEPDDPLRDSLVQTEDLERALARWSLRRTTGAAPDAAPGADEARGSDGGADNAPQPVAPGPAAPAAVVGEEREDPVRTKRRPPAAATQRPKIARATLLQPRAAVKRGFA